MEISEITAVTSAAMAICALVLGMSNRRTARRALSISERQEARRQASVSIYLISSTFRSGVRSGWSTFGVNVRISNPADHPVTLVTVDLHVQVVLTGGALVTIKVPAVDHGPIGDIHDAATQTGVPFAIDAHGARVQSFEFHMNDSVTSGQPVDRFDLVVTDVEGRSEMRQIVGFYEAPT